MIRLLVLAGCILLTLAGTANTIVVKNIDELTTADKQAKPGDIIILQNGEWKNVTISLGCSGTKQQPITFKAQTPGKVIISGRSSLRIGGNYITVDGLYFLNGYAGNSAVIDFRINKDHLANNCRVTNCVVNDFNNPKRMDENNWVLFYGKNNRLDHCSFINKKNMGVLLAVILDDERSRENHHSIDQNYFGIRLPLASNGGEIIRVGVSQHCEFNSNTAITQNFFEQCDGEAEIVSIKSGGNLVRDNLFKECQGSVVLRHGNFNTVEGNIFLGNNKEGTGGVRVINKGQWVINNFFYKCRGIAFRSPLTIMNGIPNSPAHRYVQVTDAIIAQNTFYDCSPVSFCDGSDAERTLPPQQVVFAQNIFYNTKDSVIYRSFDDIGGFRFANNKISTPIPQQMPAGFERTSFSKQYVDAIMIPHGGVAADRSLLDSITHIQGRKVSRFSNHAGFNDEKHMRYILQVVARKCGAQWYKPAKKNRTTVTIPCKNMTELRAALTSSQADNIVINLTSPGYQLTDPLRIVKNTEFITTGKQKISFRWPEDETPVENKSFIEVKGGSTLTLTGLNLDFKGYERNFRDFIRTDTTASSEHVNLVIRNCTFSNLQTNNGAFLHASRSVICDSIVIVNNNFLNNNCDLLSFMDETDKKGYYNTEKLVFANNRITGHTGAVLQMLRGGNDESTLGPALYFTGNKLLDCQAGQYPKPAMIDLTGTQVSRISNNQFTNCFAGSDLLRYEDVVRAIHLLNNNTIRRSGKIVPNKFVQEISNSIE